MLSLTLTLGGVLPAFGAGEEPAEETEAYSYALSGLGMVTAADVQRLGGGVQFYKYSGTVDQTTNQTAFVLEIDPLAGGRIAAANLGDGIYGLGRPGTLIDRDFEEGYSLVAAVNGDFYSMATGVPMGVYIENGRFVSSSDGNTALGINRDGSAFFGTVGDRAYILENGEELPISYINKYPSVYGVYLLTEDYGATTKIPESLETTEYILELDGELRLSDEIRAVVTEIREDTADGEIPAGCAVLVVPKLYETQLIYRILDVGDRITLGIESGGSFDDVEYALGGGDIILQDGEIVDGTADLEHEKTRQPRTAVGLREDGGIVIAVIDGRQLSYSSGMTLYTLAAFMRDLGCTSALNLDGGGSSCMVLFGAEGAKTVSRPSDGSVRRVSNALAILEAAEADNPYYIECSLPDGYLLNGQEYVLEPRLMESTPAYEETGGEKTGSPEEDESEGTETDGEGENKSDLKAPEREDDVEDALSANKDIAVDFLFDEDNTSLVTDEQFGSARIEDGKIYFTPTAARGLGRLQIETETERGTVSLDLFLRVTDSVDQLTLDQSLLLPDENGQTQMRVCAFFSGEPVWFGNALEAKVENDNFSISVSGNVITVRAAKGSGRIAAALLDQTAVLPAYFDPDLSLLLTEALDGSLSAEEYETVWDETAGILGAGAFILRVPEPENPDPASDEGTSDETKPDESSISTVAAESGEIETMAETSETAGLSVSLPESSESSDSGELLESSSAENTSKDSQKEDGRASSASSASSEPVEPEEECPPAESFTIEVAAGALRAEGLWGRRLWMWVDGLAPDSSPYAVVSVTDQNDHKTEYSIPYEIYYDFRAYNGRALLVLTINPEERGIVELENILCYTASEMPQRVTLENILLTERYDTNRFADLDGHWSKTYVNMLSYMGVISGSENLKGELVYIPNDEMSREQFAKILVGYLGIDTEEYAQTPLEFEDVSQISEWALPFVRAATGAGLMRGKTTVSDTLIFAPKDSITRQEAIYVLGALLPESEDEIKDTDFTDSDKIAPWADENLRRAYAQGLISGYDDGSVRPESKITRAEAATLVVKLEKILENN